MIYFSNSLETILFAFFSIVGEKKKKDYWLSNAGK